jgi:hypothetical protein
MISLKSYWFYCLITSKVKLWDVKGVFKHLGEHPRNALEVQATGMLKRHLAVKK